MPKTVPVLKEFGANMDTSLQFTEREVKMKDVEVLSQTWDGIGI